MKFFVRVKDGDTTIEFKIEAETADEARRSGLNQVYGETGFEPEEAELAYVTATPLFPIETFADPD